MNFKQWLEGTVNLKHIGNWDKDAPNRGWNHADIHLTTSPDRVERIHKFFKNCPFDFDITLVRDKKAHSFREIGVVTSKWIKENLNLDYKPNPMAINIVFTNNLGDQKVPFTPWIMAHRFGHAVRFEKDWQYFTKELDEDDDFKIRVITSKGDKVDHRVKSMILDVFDFNLEEFSGKLSKYDLIHDVLDPNKSKPYLVQDRLKDTILF